MLSEFFFTHWLSTQRENIAQMSKKLDKHSKIA